MTQKIVLRYRGQPLLDNALCQAAAALDSGALPFPRHRALLVQWELDRHAKGSPSGRGGCEADGEGMPLQKSRREADGEVYSAVSFFFAPFVLYYKM